MYGHAIERMVRRLGPDGGWLAATAIALLVTVGVASSLIHGWIPISDHALMELRVSDVPADLPLVGPWSRFGWNHPGPAQFYFLSLFYWLGGHRSEMLLVGTVFMHLFFGVIAWLCAKEVSRTAGAIVVLGALALVVTTDASTMRDPWNPNVVILGGLTLCCAAWSLSERQRAGALSLFAVGSFLIQEHLVTAPFVVLVCTAAMAGLFTTRRKPLPVRDLVAGVAIAVAMWLPPLIEQLTASSGNLSKILDRGSSGEAVGAGAAMKTMTHALALWPDVLNPATVNDVLLPANSWAVPLWLFAFVAVMVVLVRRAEWTLVRGGCVACAGLVGSTVAIAMITGGGFNYLALARRASVVFMLVICLAGLVALRPNLSEPARRVAYGLTAVLAAMAAVLQIGAHNPLESYAPTVRDFVAAIESADLPRAIAVRENTPDFYSNEVARALLLALEKDGYSPAAPTLDATHLGAHRARREYRYMLTVSAMGTQDQLTREGWRIIAVHDPFDPAERAQLDRLEGELAASAGTRSTDEQLNRSRRIAERIDELRDGRVDLVLAGRTVSR